MALNHLNNCMALTYLTSWNIESSRLPLGKQSVIRTWSRQSNQCFHDLKLACSNETSLREMQHMET